MTVPVQTPYKSFNKSGRTWNEWLEVPIEIAILPSNAQLALTIWDVSPTGGPGAQGHKIPFGGTTISVFSKENTLQQGRQSCRVYRSQAADGYSSTTTPAQPAPPRNRDAQSAGGGSTISADEAELERLTKLFKKHESGEIPQVDWLDAMVFKRVDELRRRVEASARILESRSNGALGGESSVTGSTKKGSETDKTNQKTQAGEEENAKHGVGDDSKENFTLQIDFAKFDFPIVFTDHEYPPPPISALAPNPTPNDNGSGGHVKLKPPPEVQLGPGINSYVDDWIGMDDDPNAPPLIRIYDPEVGAKDNPCETKHRRLVRSHRTGVLDRDLKPNAKIRDELNTIMEYGPTQELKSEEKDLVWKFRHHLTKDKRALTKFIKSVAWQDQSEARQAVQLLPKWTQIDVDDALELLGPTFDNPAVRAYAVDRLRESDDEELLLYLLQLVQALKFERMPSEATDEGLGSDSNDGSSTQDSSLARFLISRAIQSPLLGNFLHWYLIVECDDRSPDQRKEDRKLFAKVEYDFMNELTQVVPGGNERRKTLLRQGELITVLSKISKEIRFSREDRPHKLQRLKKYLADPKNELTSFDPPLPLPLDPTVEVTACDPTDSVVFKSSLFPLLVHFRTTTGTKYPVIFKTGDDLRQDQLVIQIISLMDRLLRKENLDLKLTPYRILATSATAGAVQFIPSTSLAAASTKYKGSILAYLRANNPDATADLGVRKEAMDTYVKSCAGYCVITYILGVGDRHLDNLLLSPDGHFFHADFGYILGRDPKPFAPQMKLCREMVEGMGGSNSSQYADFKSYCFTAYTALRKSSNLILNLFSLMVDANITDIRLMSGRDGGAPPPPPPPPPPNASGAAVYGASAAAIAAASNGGAAVEKVRERFHLEMSDEEAMRHFEGLIGDSVGAIFPVFIDTIHNMMQGLRA